MVYDNHTSETLYILYIHVEKHTERGGLKSCQLFILWNTICYRVNLGKTRLLEASEKIKAGKSGQRLFAACNYQWHQNPVRLLVRSQLKELLNILFSFWEWHEKIDINLMSTLNLGTLNKLATTNKLVFFQSCLKFWRRLSPSTLPLFEPSSSVSDITIPLIQPLVYH